MLSKCFLAFTIVVWGSLIVRKTGTMEKLAPKLFTPDNMRSPEEFVSFMQSLNLIPGGERRAVRRRRREHERHTSREVLQWLP